MRVSIQLTYISRGIRVYRRGSFETGGRAPERIVLDWTREIKKEMEIDSVLEVIVDGNVDITEKVLELEKAPLE